MDIRAFTDSGRLLSDRAALTRRLATDGYVFLPGFLPAHRVATVRDTVLTLAREAGWLLPGRPRDPLPVANPAAAVWPPDPRYARVHRSMWSCRALHALLHDPALLALLEDLLGEPVFVHPRKVLRVVHPRAPGAPPESGWHQDHPGVQGSPRTLTVWTPLTPVTADSGSLCVLPGSHGHGQLPMRLSNEAVVGWEADIRPSSCLSNPMNPGDLLIIDPFTVHRGTPNTSRTLRISTDCRYQPLHEPVNEGCVELLGEPYTWDEVYRTWPRGTDDPLAYYWKRQPARTVPYDAAPDDRRDQQALAAGRAGDRGALRALRIAARHSPDPDTVAEAQALCRSLSTPPAQDHNAAPTHLQHHENHENHG
ncbi:phytanoyl-CoA dioxygenase family protein [Streptomyces sp. NPDC021093]|uniref:phytanoyl-CoA dioxygenase family protein n=1 Tax=Streptomyces sp. NPDC021093 TaxID=3365112 RepID=UPI0037AC3CCC